MFKAIFVADNSRFGAVLTEVMTAYDVQTRALMAESGISGSYVSKLKKAKVTCA